MPLETRIIRGGKPLSLRWGGFHIAAMVIAAAADSGQGPWEDNTLAGIYQGTEPDGPAPVTRSMMFDLTAYHVIGATPLNEGSYTLKGAYTFVDAADGEILELCEGDRLVAYRAS